MEDGGAERQFQTVLYFLWAAAESFPRIAQLFSTQSEGNMGLVEGIAGQCSEHVLMCSKALLCLQIQSTADSYYFSEYGGKEK